MAPVDGGAARVVEADAAAVAVGFALAGARRRRLRPAALAADVVVEDDASRKSRTKRKSNEGNPEIKARVRQGAARDGAPPHAAGDVKTRDRRHHQPDPLRRRARIPPRQDGGADGRRQGRRTTWRSASARSRASTACRSSRTRRSRARSTRAPRSATRFPAELFGAVAEVLAYLVRIKQLML